MGVPKFYRWMSERYPCLSETVKEHQIPEFDNLYLDMNGIIHNCSHPNDEDPHFRITEDKIFADIFHYIEFLFRMIKPQQVFFMAIDGVAPRAKMNQQRGRRFRTARDAELSRKQALERGEILPSESQFDSNCITPGTKFMASLHEQLKYFVSMKVTTDKCWQKCKIYLSGHETPGEGEHKIMDFIRYHKSQPNYNPNTRHCLYGLDADLMMLGLCSHEPHFSLLREEVKFGKKNNQKRDAIPEQITFHLLHLSLMRDYICHEFQALKTTLPFSFDLERIIDDWVLMGFLVGNDFIPNLPGFHINKNALPMLYSAYIEVLPSLQGYINEAGFLNLERFQAYLKRLGQMDFEQFKDVSGDFKYLESKMSRPHVSRQKTDCASLLDGLALAEDSEEEDFEEVESDNSDETSNMEFRQHKRDYYITKMEYENVTKEVLQEQATEYVRAIQWNLHYYYNGIVSWSWYYPHHYAPYISDVTDFSGLKIEFDLAKPFLPFQQLLAVLPEASKVLLPHPYQLLMTEEDSPLKKFYPTDFKTDQNGKQNEWEAVVLIPFIDEKLMLQCMDALKDKLTPEETERNRHGPHLLFTYSEASLGIYASALPFFFPDIPRNHARCEMIDKNTFFLPYQKLKKGLCPGVDLESYFPGFPSLKHLEHTAALKKAPVMVFQTPVRNEAMVLTLKSKDVDDLKDLSGMIEKVVYVGWPHLIEARVQAITDGTWKLKLNEENCVSQFALSKVEKDIWKKRAQDVQDRYIGRWGVYTGPIDFLIEASVMNGRRFVCGPGGVVTFEKQWSKQINPFALQAIVQGLENKSRVVHHFKSVAELFPPGLQCFHLGYPHYGLMGSVEENNGGPLSPGKVAVKFQLVTEPNLTQLRKKQGTQSQYFAGYQVAQRLAISGHLLSRFTGTFFVQTNLRESMSPVKVNIGLNLKFNKKNEEIPGYSRKGTDGNWMYSIKTIDTMSEYLEKFSELFDNVNVNLNRDYVHVDDLFPNGKGKAYIQVVHAWLKDLPCSNQERVVCGAQVLDPALVEEIERVLENLEGEISKWTPVTIVDAEHLYRPMPLHYTSIPDSSATFCLFDRVVNVREGYAVPLGLRGTIIGIPSPPSPDKLEADCLYDVLFDETFMGGVSLLCCSRGRGYRLPSAALINLTHAERTTGSSSKTSTETMQAHGVGRQTRPPSDNSYAKKILQPPRLQQQSTNYRQGQRGGTMKGSPVVPVNGNGMVRLERTGGKLRRRVTQEPADPAHHFNHSPHSPFVPHLLFQGGNKTNHHSNTADPLVDFVTPKFSTTNSSRRNNQQPQQQQAAFQALPPQAVQRKGGSEDEFTSIWEEMKQARTLEPKVVPSVPITYHVISPVPVNNVDLPDPINIQPQPNASYHKKVSIDDIMQQAKAAEEAEKHKNLQQRSSGNCSHSSAVMELMQLVSSTIGGLPAYKYNSFGPTPVFSAVVTLPDGRTFNSSKLEPNQDLASESAAEQALLVLRNLSLGSGICNIRPTMPAAFQTGPFGSPSLNAAPLMLPTGQLGMMGGSPLFPAGVRVPPPLLSHNNNNPLYGAMGLRGPAPPAIYNIPPSFVAHNQIAAAASQWEAMQSPRRQHPAQSKLNNHLLQGQRPRAPAVQDRQNPLNPIAIEFVPTQVARKQAGSKRKGNEQKYEAQVSQKTLEPAREKTNSAGLKPLTVKSCATTLPSDIAVAKSPWDLAASPGLVGSSAPNEQVLPQRKTRSRLAVKFSNQ